MIFIPHHSLVIFESNAMNYIYASTLSSMILCSSICIFGMQSNQSRRISAEISLKSSEIVQASIIQMCGREHFNVEIFKQYITQHGATLAANDLISASQSTYMRLIHDHQERIIAMRDYTAAMIAINKIKPGSFYYGLINHNKREVMRYYATNPDMLHIANHRFEVCSCQRYAECNWPAINKK